MLRIIAIGTLAIATLTLAACNTVKGIGQDIESVGEAGDEEL